MDEAIYRKLAQVLDTLLNGFPATESGVEIRLLHKAPEALTPPPLTEDEWFELRGKLRGVDFSAYR